MVPTTPAAALRLEARITARWRHEFEDALGRERHDTPDAMERRHILRAQIARCDAHLARLQRGTAATREEY